MQPVQVIWAFLQELVLRLKAKKPKFFNILSWIALGAFILTGFPDLIETLPNVELPDWVKIFANKAAAIGSGIAWFMANLGVQRPVFKGEDEETVKVVDGDKVVLPFTERFESKAEAEILKKTT